MRKKYQRLLAVLLTWVMCLTLMQGTVRAEVFVEEDAQSPTDIIVEAEESAGENNEIEEEEIPDDLSQTSVEIYINPLYRDVISEEDLVESDDSALLQSEESGNGEERVSLSSEEYGSVDEAVVSFREQMKSRKEIITVKVMTDDVEEIAGEISDAAMAHTGNPKEGDYLQWQFGGWKCSSSYYSFGGNYYCTMNYTMTYYTTAAQEAELDNAIALAKTNLGLNSSTMNDYQKIKAIYDYMTKNITYDYANLNDDSYRLKYTAYAAMINKTAVCQGYAVLLYRMALECGVDARVITGIGNGGAHGWNIVKLGNYYYNVDSTWDAGYPNYSYFLKTDGNFRYHTRDNEYATGDFYEAYPMAASDYNVNHVHQYGSWMTAKAATCLEEGMQMKTCSLCGDKKTQTTAKTGHTEVKDAAVEATCTSTGKTEGSHCSVCGTVIKAQTEIAKKAHTYGSWKVVKSVTCTVDGSKERSCTECGKKETQAIAKTGHTEVKDAAVEATCTSTGKTEGSHCSICGTVIKAQTEIAKKAHTYGSWKVVKSATCTVDGSKERSCTECGKKETQAIAETGHTEVKDAAVEATCTSTGKTEGSHCSVCGTVIKAQTEIAKKAHTWGAWKTISSATVFAPKKQKRTCTKCKASEIRFSGEKLKKTISVTQSSLTMQVKQKTTAFRVTFANGDSVKSWKSSNTNVVKVSGKTNGTCTITAQSKTGSATITITLKSDLKKSIKVNVQKGAVAASSLKLPSSKVEVKKGKTFTLKPVVAPITSQSKVTYSTSNKSVATVSSSGVIKGVKKGTAKITVKAGTKKVVCTVIVK
ncbi:MAG: Ig-like domain-containing protein [Lachnospiraceae bacterium]|nr:Ig-like domain-containing protein [Lachnospiraceae bacterium]